MNTDDLFPGQTFQPTPPISFPSQLRFRKGERNRLCGLSVWHDFDWLEVFGHDGSYFKNGKSLAKLIQSQCPDEMTPHLILHSREDIQQFVQQTHTDFVVIINVHQYRELTAKSDISLQFLLQHLPKNTPLLDQFKATLESQDGKVLLSTYLTPDHISAAFDGESEKLTDLAIGLLRLSAPSSSDSSLSEALLAILKSKHLSLLPPILQWAARSESTPLLEAFESLSTSDVATISTFGCTTKLKALLTHWQSQNSEKESFWQKELEQNTFVFSFLFSYPIIFVKGTPHVGNTSLSGTGGQISDFLLKSDLSRNALFIEIKRPDTQLLSEYRSTGIYSPSHDLAGACMQVLSNRMNFIKESHRHVANSDGNIQCHDPQCLVIVGKSDSLNSRELEESFELFSHSQSGISVITFDELFKRMQNLIDLIEGRIPIPGFTVHRQTENVTSEESFDNTNSNLMEEPLTQPQRTHHNSFQILPATN